MAMLSTAMAKSDGDLSNSGKGYGKGEGMVFSNCSDDIALSSILGDLSFFSKMLCFLLLLDVFS